MEAKRYYISGIVQGVGYRYFAKRRAELYGIVGYVKNLPDGRVEVFAQGDEEVLWQFERELREGPALCKVNHVDVQREELTIGLRSFEIKYW